MGKVKDKLIAECDSAKTICSVIGYDGDKLLSEFNGSQFEQNISPLFIDIETTGLINNPLDYKSYPNIIQVSYTQGRNLEIFSFYIKPDGFSIPKEALYYTIPTKKIVVDSSITDLAKFAKTQGVNYKILKIHNPWLRDKKLTNTSGKKYEIEIPTSGYNKQ